MAKTFGQMVKEAREEVGVISPADAKTRLDQDPSVRVIDVRQANEYEAYHVPGSIHISAGSLPDRLAELPTDHPVVTICAAGLRAGVAASILRSAGFADVSWVANGVPAWRAAGHPTVRGDQPTRGGAHPADPEPARTGS